MDFIETSAKSAVNVNEVFQEISRQIKERVFQDIQRDGSTTVNLIDRKDVNQLVYKSQSDSCCWDFINSYILKD